MKHTAFVPLRKCQQVSGEYLRYEPWFSLVALHVKDYLGLANVYFSLDLLKCSILSRRVI